MKSYIEAFLIYLTAVKRYSKHTTLSYQNDLFQFVDYINREYDIQEIKLVNHLLIRSWIASLKLEGIANSSINRKISALKSWYKYLRRKSIVDKNPMAKILTLKKSKRLPSYVPESKMNTLTEKYLMDATFADIRDQLIILIFYNTGMRRNELINIRLSDVHFDRKEIKVIGKGNKERLCPISQSLIDEMKKYLLFQTDEFGKLEHDYLLVTNQGKPLYPKLVYNIVKRYMAAINAADKNSPHVLRHTFATHLSANGAELNAVKELLGHASLAATQIYTHNSIERLKEEYKRSHPTAD